MLKKHLPKIGIICTTLLLTACAGYRPNINIPHQAPPARRITTQPRVALVLGAGGAKGFAHLGVIDVLRRAGVPIDMVAGASAGSIVAALYADNANAKQATTSLMSAGFWDLADVGNLPSAEGVITGYRLEKFLLSHMRAKTFRQTKIPLMIATTDLKSGKLYPIRSGPIAPAVLASGAMPGAVRPPYLYGHILVDGGMVAPVPVQLVTPYHPKLIIAVNIDEQLDPTLPWSAYGIYNRAYQISWLALTRYTEAPADIVIRPNVGEVGTFDWSQKWHMYDVGVAAAKKALPNILKMMKARHIKRVY